MKYSFVLAAVLGGTTVLALPTATSPSSFKYSNEVAKRDLDYWESFKIGLGTLFSRDANEVTARGTPQITPEELIVLKVLHDMNEGHNSKRDLDYWESFKIGLGTLFSRDANEVTARDAPQLTPEELIVLKVLHDMNEGHNSKRDLDYWESFKIGLGTLFSRDANEVAKRDLDYWESFKIGFGTLFGRDMNEVVKRGDSSQLTPEELIVLKALYDLKEGNTNTKRDLDYWESFKIGLGTLFGRDINEIAKRGDTPQFTPEELIVLKALHDMREGPTSKRDIDYWESFKIGFGTLFDRDVSEEAQA